MPPMEPKRGDALGSALLDALAGRDAPTVIERNDGLIAVDGTDYFGGLAEQDEWAVARARGRVVDVGAGAGRAVTDGLAGAFDSALLLGNNLGLLGSRENAVPFLATLGRLLKPD